MLERELIASSRWSDSPIQPKGKFTIRPVEQLDLNTTSPLRIGDETAALVPMYRFQPRQ